ncbi:putative methyltransferase C9orf114 isoform X2 [Mangifera indica]|uniref:putative methyltransferase C9orf114 isoform X2 n=1 Tax=Mangifera indica TaxID=29780 RepID=UPI001CFB3ADB|nr:putative methyltransferase C9orf114 isoform X2 [Mangifera indica]
MGKKKKRTELEVEPQTTSEYHGPQNELDLSNSAIKKKRKKRDKQNDDASNEIPTVSIAVPGSIIDNAQSLELATRLAGQIARAATIFRIDEVVVFDSKSNSVKDPASNNSDENESGATFLFRILRYLETPQYLRKALFPMHSSLRFVGMLPPLDAPHHLRKHEWAPFREGVTLKERVPSSGGTLVDVGLNKNVPIGQALEPGVRVTVAMGTSRNLDSDFLRKVVPASKPKEKSGMYWGYKGGYDHLIGTSEHGDTVNPSELTLPNFRHLLIAFGGLAGLEESIEEDDNLKQKNAREVFDSYFNTCPHQGSRTIRTEEAIFISLQYFQEPISRALQRRV